MLSDLFSGMKYYQSSDDIESIDAKYLIIDNVPVTMSHPLIDIDIVAVAKKILDGSTTPGTRSKEFFALVTGMGRGKTRFLVELDLELKKHPNVCSVAITFNHFWDSPPGIVSRSPGQETDYHTLKRVYAVAIVSRIVSIHYHMPFDDALLLIERLARENLHLHAKDLIRECVRFIVAQMRRDGRPIDRFVLLVDESMKIEKTLRAPDIHNVLRSALLDLQLMDESTEQPLAVDLVMSSLDIKSTGVSSSGRGIVSLTTPTRLDSTKVLKGWVRKGNESDIKMLSLIECLSPLPRAVEIMVTELERMGEHTAFDPSKMKALYETTIEIVGRRYVGLKGSSLPARYGKALLFGEEVAVDDNVMKYVETSLFVNALTDLAPDERTKICPETSIVSMHLLKTDVGGLRYQKIIVDTINSLLDNLVTAKGIQDAGKPMEIIVRGLIDARLQVLADLDSTERSGQFFSLASLLMLGSSNYIDSDYEGSGLAQNSPSVLDSPNMQLVQGKCKRIKTFPRSNDFSKSSKNVFRFIILLLCFAVLCFCLLMYMVHTYLLFIGDAALATRLFLEKANMVELTPGFSFVSLSLDPGECADGMWLFRDQSSNVFVLAMDCKSKMIGESASSQSNPETEPSPYTFINLPGRGSQAQHFLNVVSVAKTWREADVRDGSMLDALRKGRFLYTYVNTLSEATFAVGEHVLHMGRVDSERFLSFFSAYYSLHRSSSGSADAEQTRRK